MSRKGHQATCMLVCLLLTISSIATVYAKPASVQGRTVRYVGGHGPGNYTSVQAAIDNATDGDLIYIFAGVYASPLNITKSLSLQGEDAKTTVIDGLAAKSVLNVTSPWVDVSRLTFSNGSLYGLYIQGGNGSSIKDCRFSTGGQYGIWMTNASNITIDNVTIADFSFSIVGIASEQAMIDNCRFSTKCGMNINDKSNHWIISSCTMIREFNTTSSTSGICITRSSWTNIQNCTIANYACNIRIWQNSRYNQIINCLLTGSDYETGQYSLSVQSPYNTITLCTIADNGEGGIALLDEGNLLTASTIRNNGHLVKTFGLYTNTSNTVYHNNFISNYCQAYDNGSLSIWSWNSQGNYWDDYKGRDWNRDNIGRQPYHLCKKSNTDKYPLLCPYNDGPSVHIQRPTDAKHTYLYLLGLRLIRFPRTLLLGPIHAKALATVYPGDAHIVKVEFYIDGTLRHTDKHAPYTWNWLISKKLHHVHTLTVIAYDDQGRHTQDTLTVHKFL
jgi:parallel beta-helix repeat protein